MICAALRGMQAGEGVLDCLGSPAAPWAWILAAAVAAISVWLAWRTTGRAWARVVTAGSFAVSAGLLALATSQPVLRQTLGQGDGGSIVVLADRSESFWRDRGRASAALAVAADRLDDFLAGRPPDERDLWRGVLLPFGAAVDGPAVETAATNLPAALRTFAPEQPASTTNLANALLAAQSWLRDKSGHRMVIVVSDGLTRQPPDQTLLDELAADGIRIHVLLDGARAPSAGLVSADVGPEHRVGEEVVLRATVLGGGQVTLDDGATARSLAVDDARNLRAVRLVTRFAQRGLQGVSLMFEAPEGQQQRRLFTLVRGPARVLVFGAAPWADSLPPARWLVERADPARPPAPGSHDLVIIDALSPAAFPPGFADDLLAFADGTAVLLVNGPLRGSVEDEQVISDWTASSLDPILPVDSDPRMFVQDPPPRDVVILVDVSGSMGQGVRLETAKDLIRAILVQLRPVDTIAILPFREGTQRVFAKSQATATALDEARRFTDTLFAAGGTAPAQTILDSASFVSNSCAFFFISDADFPAPPTAPLCHTTAISVSSNPYRMDVSRFGEEIILGEGGSIGAIRFEYFNPEERAEYFRAGSFVPLPVGALPGAPAAPQVDGLAIAYPRADAHIDQVHPSPPPDPVFAWRRDAQRSGVVTGAFLGPMNESWGAGGLAATEAMLNRLLGWPDQDRFLVRLMDRGQDTILTVTPVGAPATAISATLQWPDGTITGIPLRSDPMTGSFSGALHTTGATMAGRALLSLQEGDDVQRIPVFLPAANLSGLSGSEALDFGIDRDLGRRIASAGAGSLLDEAPIPQYGSSESERKQPLHEPLVAIALAVLGLAVWSRELRSR